MAMPSKFYQLPSGHKNKRLGPGYLTDLRSRATRDLTIAAILEKSGLAPNKNTTKRFYRQALCLCLRIAGQNAKQCACLLNITENTVKKHEQRLRERLNVSSRMEAYRMARQRGYIIESLPQ